MEVVIFQLQLGRSVTVGENMIKVHTFSVLLIDHFMVSTKAWRSRTLITKNIFSKSHLHLNLQENLNVRLLQTYFKNNKKGR